MILDSGESQHNGTFAYMPQEPWILNATFQDNILLGSALDSEQYWNTIEACALQEDLDSLPAGDMTEIGERGITLSGGQKHRLSLARAIYADADIYLIDDPLSAVDAVVASHLLDNVFCDTGILANKARVLVTHSLSCLPRVDRIVLMEEGEIVNIGHYSEMEQKMEHKLLIEELNLSSRGQREVHAMDNEVELKKSLTELGKTSNAILMTEEITSRQSTSWKSIMTYGKVFHPMCIFAIFLLAGLAVFLEIRRNFQIASWTEEWEKNATTAMQNNYHNINMFIAYDFAAGSAHAITIILITLGGVRAARLLHKSTLSHVFNAKVFFYDITPIGRILNWFTQDLNDVEETIPVQLWVLLIYFVKFGIAMVSCIWISPWIVAGFIIVLLLIKLIQGLYSQYAIQGMWLYGAGRSRVYSLFKEIVQGVVSIHAYKKEKYFLDSFIKQLDESMKPLWHIAAAKVFTMRITELFGETLFFTMNLVASLLLTKLNPSIVTAVLYAAFSLLFSLNSVALGLTDILRSMVSVERLASTEKIPSELSEEKDEKRMKREKSRKGDIEFHEYMPTNGDIEFYKYSASYRPGLDCILKDICFQVPFGKKVGIVGRTGSGKSSLTYALLHMLEVANGKICIDGRDISTMDVSDLRSRITVISQDPVLFDVSLRDNLDPKGEHTDTEIWQVLEQTHLKDHILQNEGNLCEGIFQDFSLGQRQLLCLARALLRKTRILILDETTASVDVETDNMVQEILRSSLEGCTLLTIAHRINTIIDYDRVVVMEKGCVLEYDDPKVLLENTSSVFYKLVVST